MDTALLHAALWEGQIAAATELRLRVAKFGATPEDRMRMRMHVRQPGDDEPETGAKSTPEGQSASRYGHLRAVKPPA